MDFSNPLNVWWLIMVLLNVASVITYAVLCVKSIKNDKYEPENKTYKTILRVAGAIFVCVSMYRSIFVSSYPNRLTWFDSMFNSPLIIRFLATFAEISFALLVMLPILHINKENPLKCKFSKSGFGSFLIYKLPYATFICLFTAQFCAYGGLFTQHLTFFAIEETLWALGFFAILPAAIAQGRDIFKNHKGEREYRLIKAGLFLLCLYTVGYLIYQFGFSLPFTYYSQLPADLLKDHLAVAEGAKLALYKFNACRDFDTWGGIGFFIWHSGYFSLCTWMNILFASAPRKLKK